jgi:hypothetical protein
MLSPLPTTHVINAMKKASITGIAWQGNPAHDHGLFSASIANEHEVHGQEE